MQRSLFASTSRSGALPLLRHSRVIARSAAPEQEPVDQKNTVFYGGNTYSEKEWEAASVSGAFKAAPPSDEVVASSSSSLSFGSLMAFDGPAPELVNGRLAMLAVVAAIGAELRSGESVFAQLGDAPGFVLLSVVVIAIATLIPLAVNATPSSRDFGPFTAPAEMTNGRAAMLGLVALVTAEAIKGGSALF